MKGFFIIFLCTIAVHFLPCQPEIEFSPLTIDQGLSQNSVNCILQDQRGFIWIGTTEGLNRFDGIDFKIFKNIGDQKNSLSNNWIRCIHEEKEGFLWIGTNFGLNRFDIRNNTISRYLHSNSDRNSLSNNEIYCLCSDQRENLWIGTKNGLNRINLRKYRIGRHPLLSESKRNRNGQEQITGIVESPFDTLWIILNLHLYELNPRTGKLLLPHGSLRLPARISQKEVLSIHEGRGSGYWIITCDSKLHYLNGKSGESDEFPLPLPIPGRSVKTISSIYEDSEGDLWIGSYKGFFIFHRETGRFFFYPVNRNSENPAKNCVTSFFEDQSGLVWMGTYGGGVNKVKKNTQKFSTFEEDSAASPYIKYASVFSILKDSSGILWVGTSQGLKCWNPRGKKYICFRHDPNHRDSLSENQVNAICEDLSGRIWLGTSKGLNRLDKKTGRFQSYFHDHGNPASLSDDHITTLECDKEGRIWVGTISGLNLHDPATDGFIHFPTDPENSSSLSQDEISAIMEDGQGGIWVGTSGGGLNRMDGGKPCVLQRLDSVPMSGKSGNAPDILAIHEAHERTIWIGTHQGLYALDGETGQWCQYAENDGLPGNTIYGITHDGNGDLWVSTNKGIARFNPRTKMIRAFSESDGLLNNEFNRGAVFKDSEGMIFFGGIIGFNCFHPKKLESETIESQIIIRDIELRGAEFSVWDPYSVSSDPPLELNHKKNTLTFDFLLLDFRDPWKNQYKFILEGVDQEWNPPTKAHRITYSSLKPGKYNFRVKGCNAEGVWTDPGVTVKFIITPPFWKTAWFHGTAFSFLVLSLLWAHFYRVRRALIKERRKYEKISLTRQQAKDFLKGIEEFMIANKPYLDSAFSLSALSEQTSIPSHHISSIINNELKMNFSHYVNQYRIRECIRIVLDPKDAGKSLLQVFTEAGFSSRSVFNQAFFKETGQSPGEYFDEFRIKNFLAKLDLNLKTTQAIPKLAKNAGFSSPAAFHRAFKKKTGRPPQDYINEFRVHKAVKIMKDRSSLHQSLQWVAREAGFNSQSAFTLAFKKAKKESPSQFRKKLLL